MKWIKVKNHIETELPNVKINIHFLDNGVKSIIAWAYNWPLFFCSQTSDEKEAVGFCESRLLPAIQKYMLEKPYSKTFGYGRDFKL